MAASPFNVAPLHRSNVASGATKEFDFFRRRSLCGPSEPRDRRPMRNLLLRLLEQIDD